MGANLFQSDRLMYVKVLEFFMTSKSNKLKQAGVHIYSICTSGPAQWVVWKCNSVYILLFKRKWGKFCFSCCGMKREGKNVSMLLECWRIEWICLVLWIWTVKYRTETHNFEDCFGKNIWENVRKDWEEQLYGNRFNSIVMIHKTINVHFMGDYKNRKIVCMFVFCACPCNYIQPWDFFFIGMGS